MNIKEEYEIVGDVAHKTEAEKIRDYKKKWVSVDSLLNEVNNARDNGNLQGEKGFSSALFLSKLIKELEDATTLNSSSVKSRREK